MLSRPVSAPVKHTVSPAFAAGTLAPLALTVHFDVAGPVQVGVIANWASRASAVASIELRPVHPPIVTVKSTLDCRAKPVASSETEEALRSETTTAGAGGTAGAAGAGGTAAGART